MSGRKLIPEGWALPRKFTNCGAVWPNLDAARGDPSDPFRCRWGRPPFGGSENAKAHND
jgi:hypothetical protein